MNNETGCGSDILPEIVSGNVMIRKMVFAKAGGVREGHTHNFDHTMIVHVGAVHIKRTNPDGTVEERDFTAPSHCLVPKDVIHETTSLVDGTEVWCIYSHRDPQGAVVQVNDGWHDHPAAGIAHEYT